MQSPHDVLRAIYAEIPTILCQRRCAAYCGPIGASRLEVDRMRMTSALPLTYDGETFSCGYLTSGGQCSVYAVRPLICRLWGVVEDLRCPHGCEAERILTRAQALDLRERVERVAGSLVVSEQR